MRPAPYNTGKVLIGSCYEPPKKPAYLSLDEERLQLALLGLGRNGKVRAGVALYALGLLGAAALLLKL
jgi:hypothetical protein